MNFANTSIFLPDQFLWKLVNTNFQNKAGSWASSDDWSIYREGIIENTTKNMVLSVISDGTDMGMFRIKVWVF